MKSHINVVVACCACASQVPAGAERGSRVVVGDVGAAVHGRARDAGGARRAEHAQPEQRLHEPALPHQVALQQIRQRYSAI